MKKTIKFYLPKGTINEATDYYCKLLQKFFEFNDYEVLIVNNKNELDYKDNVLTVRYADQINLFFKFLNNRFNWFQGIGPEEYLMLHGKTLKSRIISVILSKLEKKALKDSQICFFVSERMKKHYEIKYKINLESKSIIIPCYNKSLNLDSFFLKDKYNKLSFVYAGGIFTWQCFETTLLIFKKVYEKDKSATLTILTSDIQNATKLINKHNVKNVDIDFVPLLKLQDRLENYKYAFLIRENHIVNNVATPTKMNTYLSCGLIPIYTSVVDSFEKNISFDDNSLKFEIEKDSISFIAEKILQHHSKKIEILDLLSEYKKIFSNYFNDNLYIKKINN